MKFAMCNEFCEGWQFGDVCRLAAEAGYDAVEIAPFTLGESVTDVGPEQRTEIRRTAADHGLTVAGLHWLLASPKGLHLNSPDPSVRRRTVDYLRAEMNCCAEIGGDRLILGSPKQRNVPDHETPRQVWERAVEVFRRLGQDAEDRDVILCIEPLAPSETDFINTAAEALRLVEEVGRPGFRMMLDVKAMCGEVEPIPRIIRQCAPHVKHIHANDANRGGPGFGDTDFQPIADALREVGYDGYVSVEVFDFSPGPEEIAGRSIRYLKEVFA